MKGSWPSDTCTDTEKRPRPTHALGTGLDIYLALALDTGVVAERGDVYSASAMRTPQHTGAAIEPSREERNFVVTFEIDECGF